jgi:hypothetical protein
MRRSRRVWLLGVCSAAGLCVAACLSPTLPLPPPAVPDVEQTGEGRYRLTGTIPIPGQVVVEDVQSGLGFTKLATHEYQLDIAAEPGDLMRVHYQSGDDVSDYAEFSIPKSVPVPVTTRPDAGAPTQPRDASRD